MAELSPYALLISKRDPATIGRELDRLQSKLAGFRTALETISGHSGTPSARVARAALEAADKASAS